MNQSPIKIEIAHTTATPPPSALGAQSQFFEIDPHFSSQFMHSRHQVVGSSVFEKEVEHGLFVFASVHTDYHFFALDSDFGSASGRLGHQLIVFAKQVNLCGGQKSIFGLR